MFICVVLSSGTVFALDVVIEPPGENHVGCLLEVLNPAIKFEMYSPFNPAIGCLKFSPTYEQRQMNQDIFRFVVCYIKEWKQFKCPSVGNYKIKYGIYVTIFLKRPI